LGVFSSLVSGLAGVAKAINDNKAAQCQLEELKRHNCVMEGHGVYLAPYKRGRGVTTKKIKNIKKKILTGKLPKMKDVTNVQLQQLAKLFHILEVFLCPTLSIEEMYRNESSVVNLNIADGPDTH